MFTTIKRHGWLSSTLRLVPVVAIAAAAMIAMAPADAGAAFNVKTFQCSGTGVQVDVSGLGNTNVCVEGIADVDLFCGCVNRGENCPNAENKQQREAGGASALSLEPKNGRVRTTFSLSGLPTQSDDIVCTAAPGTEFGDFTVQGPPLNCPGGQKAALVGTEATTTFTLCTTDLQPGEDCTCVGQGTRLAGPTQCGPTETISTDVEQDCVALFPELTD